MREIQRRDAIATNLEMVHRERTFVAADKLRLFSRSWESPNQGRRAVLIIQHGLKDHSGRYAELAHTLLARGFAVYAMDLRGHGHSEGRRSYISNFNSLIVDLKEFAGLIREDNPAIPIFFFGHGLGAIIGILATLQHAIDFHGLILSAPALAARENIPVWRMNITRLLGIILPWLPWMNLPLQGFSLDPATVADMEKDPAISPGKVPVRTAAQLLKAMAIVPAEAPEFAAPVLVLQGTADRLVNPAGSRNFYERIISSDKTLKLYPGLAHDLVHEPEKAEVIKAIVEWLDVRAPSRGQSIESS